MEWTLLNTLVVGLAVARITSLIVMDDIVEPIRHLVFKWSPPASDHELSEMYGEPGFGGRLLSCYHCVGVWVAALSYSAVTIFPEVALPVLTVAAIAQVSDTTIKASRH